MRVTKFRIEPEDEPKFPGDSHDLYVTVQHDSEADFTGFATKTVVPADQDQDLPGLTEVNCGLFGNRLGKLFRQQSSD